VSEPSFKPVMTLGLTGYNQERYIREAVDGALSQDFSPLEIIMSDDCSSDATYRIMVKLTERYSGPHRIRLNRNERNLGLAGNINRIVDLSSSDWIFIAAGDDVSLPRRARATWEAIQANPTAYSIYFDLDYIRDDPNNRFTFTPDTTTHDLPRMIECLGPNVAGASHAFRRESFRVFGPLPRNVVAEDRAIPFRSALLGSLVYVPEKVVKYRLHATSTTAVAHTTSASAYRQRRVSIIRINQPTLASFAADLLTAQETGLISPARYSELARAIQRRQVILKNYLDAWEGTYWRRIYGSIATLLTSRGIAPNSIKLKAALLLNSLCPFLDAAYHKLARNRRR